MADFLFLWHTLSTQLEPEALHKPVRDLAHVTPPEGSILDRIIRHPRKEVPLLFFREESGNGVGSYYDSGECPPTTWSPCSSRSETNSTRLSPLSADPRSASEGRRRSRWHRRPLPRLHPWPPPPRSAGSAASQPPNANSKRRG